MRVRRLLRYTGLAISVSVLGPLVGCKDVTERLPSGAVNPKHYRKIAAAEQMARGARFEFQGALIGYMRESGLMSDELYSAKNVVTIEGDFDWSVMLDQRHLPEQTDPRDKLGQLVDGLLSYKGLQTVRARSRLARLTLASANSDTLAELRAEMLVYEALAEVMLADMYCSGIPLSVIELTTDFTYRPGSPTEAVYRNAIGLLDSARTLSSEHEALVHLINLVAARAYLQLGDLETAVALARTIPNGFVFDIPVERPSNCTVTNPWGCVNWEFNAVADQKGINGLNYRSARDPRVLFDSSQKTLNTNPQIRGWVQAPFRKSRLVIASYLDARLIEAEDMISQGDLQFLTTLNTLRTDGTTTVSGIDTVYNAGLGGVAGLKPLHDPAEGPIPVGRTSQDVRLDLLMRERAFWLFFSGKRQGDLRRLVRNYRRPVEDVYPVGRYPNPMAPLPSGLGVYDTYMDVPVPPSERYNRHFHGCITRGS